MNSKIHFNLVDGKWLENFLCEVFTEKNENFDLLERDFSLCLTPVSSTRNTFTPPHLKMETDFCTASQKQATPPSHAPKTFPKPRPQAMHPSHIPMYTAHQKNTQKSRPKKCAKKQAQNAPKSRPKKWAKKQAPTIKAFGTFSQFFVS